jgi:hypothetical protein
MSTVGPRVPAVLPVSGRLSLTDLLWIANTRHGPGGHWFARVNGETEDHDHLATAAAAVRYLVDHRVQVPNVDPSRDHLRSLVAIREMVRGLVGSSAGWTPSASAILGRTRLRLHDDGRLLAEGTGWDAFIGDLMIPLLDLLRVRDRLSVCGNPACRLAFIDGSKNGTRRWCDDAGCGNRDRARRYRERQGGLDLRVADVIRAAG